MRYASLLLLFLAVAATAFAADHRPVCPGPAAPGSAHCHAHVITDRSGNPQAGTGPTGYGPAQFWPAYLKLTYPYSASLPSPAFSPNGYTIGIVDAYDDPNIESDLGQYSSKFGLPQCTTANGCFLKVNQNGGTTYPRSDSGWALEISLDVEIAHALCPNCKILLVEANSNSGADLYGAENYAAGHATVVSNSWGGNEYSGETSDDTTYFYHPNVPITFSSGDKGYGVEYPAASQWVTAVGGTTLTAAANSRGWTEAAWSGAGSGCSAQEPKPAWQPYQSDPLCSKRTVADVSADADPNTGAAVYDSVRYWGQKGWFQVGGTSLASPIIAAVYALAGGSTSYAQKLYSAPSGSLNDVTSGSNGSCTDSYLCTAVVGYDGPTGVGTPSGTSAF